MPDNVHGAISAYYSGFDPALTGQGNRITVRNFLRTNKKYAGDFDAQFRFGKDQMIRFGSSATPRWNFNDQDILN